MAKHATRGFWLSISAPSLRFLESHRHLAIVGPVGVGKTFLAHGARAHEHLASTYGDKGRVDVKSVSA